MSTWDKLVLVIPLHASNGGDEVVLHCLLDLFNVVMLITEDSPIPFLPKAPHGHSWQGISYSPNDFVFESLMTPFRHSFSWLSSLPITSSESNGPLVPDSCSKRATIKKMARGFFRLGAHATLGWSLDTSLPEILTGEDTAFDHKPSRVLP